MSDTSTGRDSDKFMLRLPDGMRDRIKDAAETNNRSMNAEIVARIEGSFEYTETAESILAEAIAQLERLHDEQKRDQAWAQWSASQLSMMRYLLDIVGNSKGEVDKDTLTIIQLLTRSHPGRQLDDEELKAKMDKVIQATEALAAIDPEFGQPPT